jgi:chemotaxis family two-component system sensor kinase Cph1
LHCDPSEVVGQLAENLFSDSSLAAIKRILSSEQSLKDILPAVPCSLIVKTSMVRLHGLIHRFNGVCVLELEQETQSGLDELHSLRQWISVDLPKLFEAESMSQLFEQALQVLQKSCDFDRLLVYQFDKDWNGTVVAEQIREMSSFINHRFPASDIPAQARALYMKKLLRILVDVDHVSSPLIPAINPLTGKSLDLSYSILRCMSPVHIEYLRNMGVAASLSISLIVRNKLWGLIVCHHKTAKTVDFATRSKYRESREHECPTQAC